MRRYPLALVAAVALVAFAGCEKPAASQPGPAPSVEGTRQASSAPPAATLPTNGRCVLITTEKATQLVGSSVTSSASNVTNEGGMTRIDGCTYVGSASNLGYDINQLTGAGVTAAAVVAQAKAAMAGQPGVTAFDVTGGDSSVAFTVAVGPKVMARIEVAKGNYTIGVNSTAADAETAKKISNGALAMLLAALG
jgi:hypothetical protein